MYAFLFDSDDSCTLVKRQFPSIQQNIHQAKISKIMIVYLSTWLPCLCMTYIVHGMNETPMDCKHSDIATDIQDAFAFEGSAPSHAVFLHSLQLEMELPCLINWSLLTKASWSTCNNKIQQP